VPAAPSCESRPRSSRVDASSRLGRDWVRAVGALSTPGDYCLHVDGVASEGTAYSEIRQATGRCGQPVGRLTVLSYHQMI